MYKTITELIELLLIIPQEGNFMTSIVLIIIAGFLIAAGLISYIVALYNGLVSAKNNFEKTFSNIDVLLEQRHDELPKLVDAARGYMKHEQSLLTEIVKQRTRYQEAADIGSKIQAENQLADLLGRFNILVEQYPDTIIARMLSYDKRAYLKVPEKKKEDVALDLPAQA